MPIIFKGVNEGDSPMDQVATHQRLLIGTAMRTKGAILELGVGWYSTPLLHEIAVTQQRHLTTIDNNEHWLAQFLSLREKYHDLDLVGWWGDLLKPYSNGYRWGLCFVDQGQPAEREYTTRLLIDRVDVFVFHDTEEGHAYGYNRILGNARYTEEEVLAKNPKAQYRTYGMFRYQWTDRCQKAWTTVASNTIDVTDWFSDLPPVEPGQEIT